MAKFRKKPVVIEATQWFKNGDHPFDFAGRPDDTDREGEIVRYYRTPKIDRHMTCTHCRKMMHHHGWIDTPEKGHIVCPGDWIITMTSWNVGRRYPCKPDVFKRTYEPVDDRKDEPDELDSDEYHDALTELM